MNLDVKNLPDAVGFNLEHLTNTQIIELLKHNAEICKVCGSLYYYRSKFCRDGIRLRNPNACGSVECINSQINDPEWGINKKGQGH